MWHDSVDNENRNKKQLLICFGFRVNCCEKMCVICSKHDSYIVFFNLMKSFAEFV